MPTREDWLKLTEEEPLEPALPIVDVHHHLWDHGPEDCYLLPELLADVNTGHNIVATVFMECRSMYRKAGAEEMKPVGEVEFAQGIAAMSASGQYGATQAAAGIVGAADLKIGAAVERVLAAQVAASPNRFRGIRFWSTWDANPGPISLRQTAPRGLLYDKTFRQGYACLARHRLSFDAWMLFHQLGECLDLARAFPEIPIVLGHFGGLVGVAQYSNRDEVFQTWKKNLAEVAKCPNVLVKLGGLGLTRIGFGYHERERPPSSQQVAEDFKPYVMTSIELFGPGRCMLESNFPVDRASLSYSVIWNAFKRMTRGFSAAERDALFRGTAARVYRLDL